MKIRESTLRRLINETLSTNFVKEQAGAVNLARVEGADRMEAGVGRVVTFIGDGFSSDSKVTLKSPEGASIDAKVQSVPNPGEMKVYVPGLPKRGVYAATVTSGSETYTLQRAIGVGISQDLLDPK
jgi:hypothetical protein